MGATLAPANRLLSIEMMYDDMHSKILQLFCGSSFYIVKELESCMKQ